MGLSLKCALVLGLFAWAIGGPALPACAQAPGSQPKGSNWSPTPLTTTASQEAPQSQDPAALLRRAVNVFTGEAFQGLPDWAKRIDVDWDYGLGKSDFSLLTVQPLFRSGDWADTIFTQARIGWVENEDLTTNFGLGYRRLLLGDHLMAGGNVFADTEWIDRHWRLGVGLELRTTVFELNANYYDALTGKRQVDPDIFERPLDGFDVEVGGQVPWVPWAHVFVRRAFWDGIRSKNIRDLAVSARLRLLPFLEIEAGRFDDNAGSPEFFMSVRLSWGGTRGTAASERLVDDQPFRLASMRKHTLDRVRREDNIRVEKTSRAAGAGGATVTVTVSRK